MRQVHALVRLAPFTAQHRISTDEDTRLDRGTVLQADYLLLSMILSSGLSDVPDKSRVQIADAVIKPCGIGSRILATTISHSLATDKFSNF